MAAARPRWRDLDWVPALLAPGAARVLGARIAAVMARLPAPAHLLDVGCGPASWLRLAGGRPVGADLALARVAAQRGTGSTAVTASAVALPFAGGSFDGVWCFGLLHHLDDGGAAAAVAEMVRVTRTGGLTVVFDSVWPERAWRRPLAWAVRRFDRGRWVRRQAELEALLPGRHAWVCERFVYSHTGLEGLWCVHARAAVAIEAGGGAERRAANTAAVHRGPAA